MTIHPAARDSERAQTDSASLASAIHTLCDHGLAHEALQVARYLVVKSPDLAVVQTAYGRALFETGETVTASDVLSRAAVQFPYAVAAHRWLAECLLQQGGTSRARAVIEKALGLAPNNPRIRELANLTHVLDNAPLAPGAWLQDVMEDDETTARIFSLQTRARIDVRPPLGHDDPTVVGPISAQSSYSSPRSARNPRPKTAEFYGVDDPGQTDELPAIPEPRRRLASIWQEKTSPSERVWRTRSLLILGALAIGVFWALWLARQSPKATVVEKTVAFPSAPIATRVQASASMPTIPISVTSDDRDRLSTEARQQGDRTKALQLARQSLDEGTATSETGLLLANLGELASARIVLNTLSANPDSNLDWLRFAVDLGAGAPTSAMPNQADTPEATLVAARASLRAGGPKALSRFLDGLQPSHISADSDLGSLRLLTQYKRGDNGARYAFNLQKDADQLSPVSAFVAGWLAGDHRRLSAFWFGRALTGHGDRCVAARWYLERCRMLHLPVQRQIVEDLTTSGCLLYKQ